MGDFGSLEGLEGSARATGRLGRGLGESERGCAGEPVAREGEPEGRGVGGRRGGAEARVGSGGTKEPGDRSEILS